jgi:hypothetical protein
MTTGSLDGLGPFVIELVAQVDGERRGYVGADDSFVPLARASTFASERAGADVAREITANHDGLLAAFVRALR